MSTTRHTLLATAFAAAALAGSIASAQTQYTPLTTPLGSQSGPSIPISNGPKGTVYYQPNIGNGPVGPTQNGAGVGVARQISPTTSVSGNVGVTGTMPSGQPAVNAGVGLQKKF